MADAHTDLVGVWELARARLLLFPCRGGSLVEVTAMCAGFTRTVYVATGGLGWGNAR